MAILIGVDEAGYGPNLGPLVIGASAWSLAEDDLEDPLYQSLGHFFSARHSETSDDQICIADSKTLYSGGGSLARLEHAVLPLVSVAHQHEHVSTHWSQLLHHVAPDTLNSMAAIPWFQGKNVALPINAKLEQLEQSLSRLKDPLTSGSVKLVDLQAQLVTAADFNEGIERWQNKAELLSRTTLELASRIMNRFPNETLLIHCDKHGGRSRYAGLLQDVFPEYLVEVRQETAQASHYCWGPAQRRTHIQFTQGGESCLATALGSMLAKYLRETSMLLFNQFWSERVDNLKPTAGYPQDARRFRQQIEAARDDLGIDISSIWRHR